MKVTTTDDTEESQAEWEEVAAFFLGPAIMRQGDKGVMFSAAGVRYAANRITALEEELTETYSWKKAHDLIEAKVLALKKGIQEAFDEWTPAPEGDYYYDPLESEAKATLAKLLEE